ncbi:hypothetical protein IAR55_002845 [Kwoniella newhampshirensis]|uniref:Uncharacterized protein n=1 Tax=Kwoniella newhampshirensis TaxID=1651941 RepID=A0AAW0YST8_9TREE
MDEAPSRTHDDLDIEIELLSSSLLPAEHLRSSPSTAWPRIVDISSRDSKLSLHVAVQEGYASKDDVTLEVRSAEMGRDEAAQWKTRVVDKMDSWDDDDDYPLYQLLTTHFLPLLAPTSSPSPVPAPVEFTIPNPPPQPYHVLLVSHHLLSSTKRKNLISLSSTLSLTGFSKPGHPGIMYAIGSLPDLEEWVREVKSWNWLALRVRAGPEVVKGESEDMGGKGKENGARGGKGRGDWVELEKISEALEWLRDRGGRERERLLIDVGVGGGK